MESNSSRKRRLTKAEAFRFAIAMPGAVVIFLAVLVSALLIERDLWGQAITGFDDFLVYSFSIGVGIFGGWVAAPVRFRKLSACIISALVLIGVAGQYVWTAIYGSGSVQNYGGLIVAATGIYFVLPSLLSVRMKASDEAVRKIELTKSVIIFSLIICAVFIVSIIGTALMAHYLPEFKMIFAGMMLLNIIVPAWRWIVDRKITGISAFVFFFGVFWKHSPLGVLLATAVGGIVAVSGYPPVAPYAAIAGFLTYEGVALFRSARHRYAQDQ